MPADTTALAVGGGLAAGGLTAAGALLAAGAVVVDGGGASTLSFTAGEVAIVSALLAAVTGALGLMFRTLQAEKAERITDLSGQLTLAQTQAGALQTALTGQTDKVVALLQGEVAAAREATGRMAQAVEELTEVARGGWEQTHAWREADAALHQRLADMVRHNQALITAVAQAQGVRLGDPRDPAARERQEEARRLLSEGGRE
jgi:hypothetical protein